MLRFHGKKRRSDALRSAEGRARSLVSRCSAVGLATALALVGLASSAAVAAEAAAPTNGTLTGNVVVIGAPAGFAGEVGVAVCPLSSSKGLSASPQYAVSGSGGSYTLTLAAGSWQVREFYSVGFQGGAFIGRPRTLSLVDGQTVRENISIRYQVPSSLLGTVTVTGIPSRVSVEQLSVIACPTSSPVVDGVPSLLCATDFLNPGTSDYSIPTLSKGGWILYVGYYTQFGLTTVAVPGEVTLAKGASLTDNVSVAYQTPTSALVEGTVTVSGAPSGFSALVGVGGCPTTEAPTTASRGRAAACSSPITRSRVPGAHTSWWFHRVSGDWPVSTNWHHSVVSFSVRFTREPLPADRSSRSTSPSPTKPRPR